MEIRPSRWISSSRVIHYVTIDTDLNSDRTIANLYNQAHTQWRDSFKELRAAERKLVESMRGGGVATEIAAQYDAIEAMRKHSAELFCGMERQGITQAPSRRLVAAADPGSHTAAPKQAPPPGTPRPPTSGSR